MTIRPAKSISSIVRRIASVAAASAASRLAATHEPRRFDGRGLGDPDHLEREQLFHGRPPSVAEVASSREHHRQVMAVRDLDRHLVADRAAGLDDRRDARPGRRLDAVGEREVGIRREDREPGPVAGPPDGDLDRDLAAGLAGADPDRRAVAGEDDRVRADVADRPPGEQQVGQLLEGRAALGHDLEPAAIEAELVQALDEQAAGDPLEVEAGDAVVAHPLGRVGRDGQQLEAGLAAQDADAPPG